MILLSKILLNSSRDMLELSYFARFISIIRSEPDAAHTVDSNDPIILDHGFIRPGSSPRYNCSRRYTVNSRQIGDRLRPSHSPPECGMVAQDEKWGDSHELGRHHKNVPSCSHWCWNYQILPISFIFSVPPYFWVATGLRM